MSAENPQPPRFPEITLERWRALVEKDLAGKSFDKTLVHSPLDGVSIAPLYSEAPPLDAAARQRGGERFRICVRAPQNRSTAELAAEVAGGADIVWLDAAADIAALHAAIAGRGTLLVEACAVPDAETAEHWYDAPFAVDPIGWRARGEAPFDTLAADLASLSRIERGAVVSTVPFHDAGADAVDEIAIALASGVAYAGAGIDLGTVSLRTTVGRDTFVELCKLRALRICWSKLLGACGVRTDATTPVHAVCSAQTLSIRDPWVNMLRVTTQMFAAINGGADIVTPNAFDQAFGEVSALGQRVARNTGLVLREESALGSVSDPAGGSYYFESLTDLLARQAWTRFQALMKAGGIVRALENGELAKDLEAKWQKRLDRLAKRKDAVLGVSDFANLGETLPHTAPRSGEADRALTGLPHHRDSESFEQLRLQADVLKPEVVLLTLGTFAESRARAGFAANFFGAGGMKTRETTTNEPATVVCLCGTDERYATEAATHAAELKKAGVTQVLLAGRPGAIERDLRTAGVDGFLYVGCDVVALLGDVLSQFTRTA